MVHKETVDFISRKEGFLNKIKTILNLNQQTEAIVRKEKFFLKDQTYILSLLTDNDLVLV